MSQSQSASSDLNQSTQSETDIKMPSYRSNWVVLKFGGSSVADPKHWQTISEQIQLNLDNGLQPFLVLSALKNVSNALEALLHQALVGVHPQAIEHLRSLHLSFGSQLGLELADKLSPWFEQLNQDCELIFKSKQITPKLHARILAIGELLSTSIGASYLNQRFSHQQIDCQWMDARELLKTASTPSATADNWHHFTAAQCNYQFNPSLSQSLSQQVDGKPHFIVTQGFIAADDSGETVLLGREGSDTSASYFAALLGAQQVQIWTDVPGVFSCNPNENNQARQLTQLQYAEAAQMAKFGAKVLHPGAIQPAADYQIPIWVKSTSLPQMSGTLINLQQLAKPQIKAVVMDSPLVAISHSDQQNNAIERFLPVLKYILALGYDLVDEYIESTVVKVDNNPMTHGLSQHYLILRYTNSDVCEPPISDIQQILARQLAVQLKAPTAISAGDGEETNNVIERLALLNVIGDKSQSEWRRLVEKACTASSAPQSKPAQSSLIRLSHHTDQGRVSLLVKVSFASQWSQYLHQQFIESNFSANEFGASWLQINP